jgi:Domain of unknown function (DUF3552).
MSDTVLALIAGLSAGLAVALGFILLYTRSQRRSASGILAAAQAEADRLRGEAVREAESSRATAALAAKMEAIKLREDADRELARRREEFERLERRSRGPGPHARPEAGGSGDTGPGLRSPGGNGGPA